MKIITDTGIDIPDKYVEMYNIDFLSFKVLIDDKEYLDGKTISVEEVYEYMRQDILPKTAQVAMVDIYSKLDYYLSLGEDCIYYTLGSKLSGTFQTATLVAQELAEKYPDRRISIMDTCGGALAGGLIVLQAALLNAANYDFDSIIRITTELAHSAEHIFTLRELDWLHKGGRLSKSQALIGNMLNIKPILHIQKGDIGVYQKVRGNKKALNTLLSEVKKRIGDFTDQIIGISHTNDIDTALKVKELLKKEVGAKYFLIDLIGPTLATHLGLSGVGILFFNKRIEPYLYPKDMIVES